MAGDAPLPIWICFEQEEVMKCGERLGKSSALSRQSCRYLLRELGIKIADDLTTAETLKSALGRLPSPAPKVDKHLLAAMGDPISRQALKDLLGCITRWTETKTKIEPLGDPERVAAGFGTLRTLALRL